MWYIQQYFVWYKKKVTGKTYGPDLSLIIMEQPHTLVSVTGGLVLPAHSSSSSSSGSSD